MINALKKIFNVLNTILHPPGINLADRGRRRLFVAFLLALIFPLIIFGVVHNLDRNYSFGLVNFFMAALLCSFIILLSRSNTGKTVYRITLVLLILLLSYWMKTGVGQGYGSMFVLSYPVFAFFLMGKKEGCIWSLLLLLVAVILLLNPFAIEGFFTYTNAFLFRYFTTFFIIFCGTYYYEAVREQFQKAMEIEQEKLQREKNLLAAAKDEVEAANRALGAEMEVRHQAEDDLRKHQENLEALVAMRTLELQKNNEELEVSEKRYRILADNVNDLIWATDPRLNFTYISPSVQRIFGYTVEEAMNLNLDQWYTPESRQKVLQAYHAQMELARQGKTYSERSFIIELSQLKKDGTVFEVELKSSLATDMDGNPIGFFGITRDIGERIKIQREKDKIQEQLVQAQRMEVLGQMAGGVAHDLNNILGALSGYSELLLMEIPEGHKARNRAEKILQSTEKGSAIIQDLLTMTRRGVTSSSVVNLNNIVLDFLKTPVFEKMKDDDPRVTFRVEFQEDLLNIKGSHVHLEKVLMNLLSNAAESISGNGTVTIRTENRYLDKPIKGYDEIKEGDYSILTVSDTGMGIPAEHVEKIFEPFYTKKTMGRSGTGLGLAIVWGTVKDHHGYIDVQTKVGQGAAFTLYFPVTREELIAPQQNISIEQYRGHGETVLVVDDVAEQREVASGLLTKIGYVVHAVSGGEEAVEYLKDHKADILVLDMIMAPGIDGLDAYRRILEIRPKQKAILVSGFSETDRLKKAQQLGAGAYVKKPYVMEKIGIAIRDELAR